MLFKNVSPLPKRHRAEAENAPAESVLRALAGLFCSVCDTPLQAENRRDKYRNEEQHSAYSCCGIAHCPYCGASAKEKCRHLLASRVHGEWRIFGLPDVQAPVPLPPPVSTSHLLDYSDAQKQAAFREAYPLFDDLYGAGWCKNPDAISGNDIATKLSGAENRQDIPVKSGTPNQFYFGTRPDEAMRRITQVLTKDMPAGFDRLLQRPAPGSEFIVQAICLTAVTDPQKHPVTAAFSPCGRLFALAGANSIEIWQNDVTAKVPLRITLDTQQEQYDALYRSIKFSPDSTHISARRFEPFPNSRLSGVTEIRTVADGSLRALLPERTNIAQGSSAYVSNEPALHDGFLHNGATYVQVRWRCIHLFAVGSASQGEELGPYLTLTLRLPLSGITFAPDGETFITTLDSHAVIWRIPSDKIPSTDEC